MKVQQSRNNKDQSEAGAFNVKEFLMKYVYYLWLFALILGVSFFCAWLYLRYTKPIYSVSATLLIRNENNTRGGGSGNAGDMFADIALFQSNTNKQNEIQILSSRSMMERVVRALGINYTYYVKGNVKTTNIYKDNPVELEIVSLVDSTRPVSFAIQFTGKNTFRIGEETTERYIGNEFKTSNGVFKLVPRPSSFGNLATQQVYLINWMPIIDAAKSYAGGLVVKPANDLSTVLSIQYTTDKPELGADIVNKLLVEYGLAAIEDKNEINKKILAFMSDRLKLVEDQLAGVEKNIQQLKISNNIIDLKSQSEMYFGNISTLNSQVVQQEIQLGVVELLEEYINQPKNRFTLVPTTLGITEPTLLELVANYNKLVAQRASELQTGATVNNPIVKSLETEIEEARLKIYQTLLNIKKAYRNALNTLKEEGNSIKREIASIPEKEFRGLEHARQQEIKQNLYLYLLQKKEESEIAQAAVISNSRILDKALPVYNRVSPISSNIYSMALLVGLLLPVLIIFILELMNDKVITRADITKVTDAPILGELGHSSQEKVLLLFANSRNVVAEQFRILRSNMQFILGDVTNTPVVLVTSSFSGEGKSFVSTNLGASFAISGKRTVVLEFDLRKPKIIEGLELQKQQGLTNYLVGAISLETLPQAVPSMEGFYVIPCGPLPPNPAELLYSPKIEALFVWLRKNFDIVIVDTAPVGLVSDAINLSKFADMSVYVVRQRYTYKRQIQFVDDLYQEKKLPRIGLLVNDVRSDGVKGYYGYAGKYGYGYGYGYGQGDYFNDDNKGIIGKISRMFSRKKK